ncbi:MAG: FAD-dependent oxidoreductase [Christensenellales bacterium]
MKKVTCWALCLVMVLGLAACGAKTEPQTPVEPPKAEQTPAPAQPQNEASKLTAGEYEATAKGHNGPLTLKVTFDENGITAIDVVESVETADIAQSAFDLLFPAIIGQQNIAVDVVTGATFTSNAVLQAVTDAILAAGGTVEQFTKSADELNNNGQTIEMTTDVVILGAGAAGLSAAIEARQAGASVIVLEKLAHVGGNTYISGGYVYGTGSQYQISKGLTDDSPEALVEYWMERADGNAWKEMLQIAAERSGETIDWLVANGVEFGDPVATGISPVKRAVRSPSGGVGLVEPIEKKAREVGAEILLNTAAEELLTEGGKVTGVRAVSGNDTIVVHADAVILATGGFDASTEAKAKYSPDITNQFSVSSPGNVGDGIRMAQEVGADLVMKGGYIGLYKVPEVSYKSTLNKRFTTALLVTEEGKRFVNEAIDYPILHKAMVESGSEMFYQVFDSTTQFDDVQAAIEAGVAFTGNTIEELAKAAGLPEAALVEAVNAYNAAGKAGVDEAFGKAADKIATIEQAPYYILKLAPATIGSLGGVKVDLDTHVLDTQGKVIEGFFAVGAVANGDFFNKTYPASGTSISMCFTYGRIAGTNAAAYALR